MSSRRSGGLRGAFQINRKWLRTQHSEGRGMGVDGVKGCSCPVDGPGRRRSGLSGARRGRASAGPGQFRARLICERNVGAGRLGVPVICITVALARAAEIRVELCLKHRARNCERSVGGSGGSQKKIEIDSFDPSCDVEAHSALTLQVVKLSVLKGSFSSESAGSADRRPTRQSAQVQGSNAGPSRARAA